MIFPFFSQFSSISRLLKACLLVYSLALLSKNSSVPDMLKCSASSSGTYSLPRITRQQDTWELWGLIVIQLYEWQIFGGFWKYFPSICHFLSTGFYIIRITVRQGSSTVEKSSKQSKQNQNCASTPEVDSKWNPLFAQLGNTKTSFYAKHWK